MGSTTATSSHRTPSKGRYLHIAGIEDENALDVAVDSHSHENFEGSAETINDDTAVRDNLSHELSIDDAIDRLGMGIFQYRILIAAGLCFSADAMEILLLSFLSIVLKKEWHLTNDQTAFITSMVFAGALVGTSVLGPLADKWGRRPIFLLAASTIAACGAGTSLAANYEMLLIIVAFIGFGVGGLTVPFDTLAEFLPARRRGTYLLLIEYFWTLGCLMVIVFAKLTLSHEKANWRLFVVLCALPCFVSIIAGYLFVPESVRWLVSKGRNEEALHILRHAARVNRVKADTPLTPAGEIETNSLVDDDNPTGEGEDVDLIFPLGTQLTSDEDPTAENASCLDLMKPQWRATILRLWGAWGGFGLGYYGAIMTVTKVFDSHQTQQVDEPWSDTSFLNATNATQINHQITNDFDYTAIFISSSAELLGTTLVIITVDRWGRIPTQVVCYATAGACILLMCIGASTSGAVLNHRWGLVGLGFLLRALDMAATCTSWVMTAEVLSTEIRSTGHSSANAVARVGAFFCPFLVHNMSLHSLGIVMLIVHWFTAACVCQLPETMGAHLGGAGGETEFRTNIGFEGERTDRSAHDADEIEVVESEPDGMVVVDHDTDQHIRGDEPIGHGKGTDIRMLT
jgi:MFS family permease